MRLALARTTVIGLFAALLAAPAASAQVPVVFGSSWDGAGNSLQSIVDARYGPGLLNVTTDYIGHDAGDPDPFGWTDLEFDALLVREIAGNATRNVVGWYREDGVQPVIDGVNDAIVFTGPDATGAARYVVFPQPTAFGFYMNPNGPLGATNAPEPEHFFTNRRFNDRGPTGSGAIHAPFDGDVQALVFDISGITQVANTWLVCFEDLDSGAQPGPCCGTTDNDFNDFVFEVHAIGTTEAREISFGRLKAMYR
jgi:hypothetical protein